jgi:signal transduction histidine kinase/CheY-like chemotaxis protein
MERPLLEWIGVVGFLAWPLFYLLRRSSALPPLYDDVLLRLLASALCLGLALRRAWPEGLKRYYIGYAYFTVFYCLAFLMSFTMLKNQGGTPSVVNMVMGAIIIILLADWRNTVVMLVAGYATSILAYAATEPTVRVPPEFVVSAAGSILVVVAGALSHYGQKKAELERMRRVYTGLAGSIAHEVRTPLSQAQHTLDVLDSFLQRAASPRAALSPQDLQELSRTVAQGRHAVARGLQSVTLTLQQINGKALDNSGFRRLSAAHCVDRAVDEYAYGNGQERSRVHVRVVEDFHFAGDETAFVLILFNLLRNALYYLPTHPDASISITVETKPVHRVTVRDTGPGMPAELVAHLFEEFRSFGKSEGTGLGLAFCRRAMHAFGGDISCNSELGRFTEFTMTFPPAPAEAVTQDAPVVEETLPVVAKEGLAGHTVLVVDDSAFNRAIVKARLRAFGMHAIEAQHGGEALRLIDEGARPAAILMDLEMPGIGGLEATQALRRRPAPANAIPVLALSANDLPSWREAALAAGTDGYLTKPLQPELLASELLRVLRLAPAPVAAQVATAETA